MSFKELVQRESSSSIGSRVDARGAAMANARRDWSRNINLMVHIWIQQLADVSRFLSRQLLCLMSQKFRQSVTCRAQQYYQLFIPNFV